MSPLLRQFLAGLAVAIPLACWPVWGLAASAEVNANIAFANPGGVSIEAPDTSVSSLGVAEINNIISDVMIFGLPGQLSFISALCDNSDRCKAAAAPSSRRMQVQAILAPSDADSSARIIAQIAPASGDEQPTEKQEIRQFHSVYQLNVTIVYL